MGQADRTPVADVVALDEERMKRSTEADPNLTTAGGMLRAARESLGVSLEIVAERTNIKLSHLEAIEDMRINALPSQPYTMGFVRAYAREVALPEDALMTRFRKQAGYLLNDRAPGVTAPNRTRSTEGGRELSAVALLAIIGFVVWCLWKILGSSAPETVADPGRFAFSANDADREVIFTAPVQPSTEAVSVRLNGSEDTSEAVVTDSDVAELETSDTSETALAQVPADTTEEAIVDLATDSNLLVRSVTVEPVYPPLCEADAAPTEAISLTYNVSARGRVTNARISQSSNPCFNGAALAAVTRWRYDPSTVTTENSRGLSARLVFDRPY